MKFGTSVTARFFLFLRQVNCLLNNLTLIFIKFYTYKHKKYNNYKLNLLYKILATLNDFLTKNCTAILLFTHVSFYSAAVLCKAHVLRVHRSGARVFVAKQLCSESSIYHQHHHPHLASKCIKTATTKKTIQFISSLHVFIW